MFILSARELESDCKSCFINKSTRKKRIVPGEYFTAFRPVDFLPSVVRCKLKRKCVWVSREKRLGQALPFFIRLRVTRVDRLCSTSVWILLWCYQSCLTARTNIRVRSYNGLKSLHLHPKFTALHKHCSKSSHYIPAQTISYVLFTISRIEPESFIFPYNWYSDVFVIYFRVKRMCGNTFQND